MTTIKLNKLDWLSSAINHMKHERVHVCSSIDDVRIAIRRSDEMRALAAELDRLTEALTQDGDGLSWFARKKSGLKNKTHRLSRATGLPPTSSFHRH